MAQGTLSVALIAGYLGNGGDVILGSAGNTGTLEYTGTVSADTARVFTMTGTGAFDVFQASMNMGITNAIGGTGGLSKLGAGTLTLKDANSYSGTTTVTGGTLAYGITNALSSGAVTVNGGTLDIKTYTDTVGAVTLTTGSITGTGTGVLTGTSFLFNGTGSASATLAGTGTVTKSGAASSTTLTGANNFTGAITLTDGILSVGTIGNGGVAGNLGKASATASNLVFDGGTLQYTGGNATSDRAFTINNGKTATIDTTANNLSFAGATGSTTSGNLTKIGAGKLTLDGINTYSGTTTISAGTLALGSGGSFANSTSINVGTAGSSGTVLDLTLKTSGFHILSGQTLGGIGTVNITGATLTVDSGAHWTPGNSIGTNAITGNLTLASGSASDFQLGNSTGSGTRVSPYNSDRSTVTGTLTLGGTLNLLDNVGANANGSVAPGAYLLFTQAGMPGGSFSSITNITGYHSNVVTSTSGSVFLDNYALAAAASTQTATGGAFHVGVGKTVSLTLNNTAPANATYTETLSSGAFSSTTANFTAAGSASGILGGGSGSGTLLVGVGTGLGAGEQSGSTLLAMQSNAVNSSGLGATSIGNQTITINATGYNLASTGFSTTSIDLGTIHAGAAFAPAALSISNSLGSGTYNETLGAALANASGVSGSGSPITIVAGAAANTDMSVGLTSTSAGHHSGTVDVQFNSQAVNGSGLGNTALTALAQTVTVSGDVFNGTGVWSGAGSAWGTSSQWTDANGVHAAPGSFASYDNVDTATFNGGGATTVNLDATSPSLKTLDLAGSSAYTIAQGSGSTSLQFKSGAGAASLTAASGGHLISAPFTLASNLTATVPNSGDTLTLSGAISGSGILTKAGAGALTLAGTNSHGGTQLDAGSIVIGAASALGSGTITFNGGVLDVTSTFTLGNAIVVNDASHGVFVESTQTLTLSGAISGSYGLRKDGNGSVVITSSSNSTPTIITSGTVSATADNAGSSVAIASGSTLAFDQSGGAASYSGAISGAGNIGVSGPLTLSGSNSGFSGNIGIGGNATLTVTSPGNLGSTSVITLDGSSIGTSRLNFDGASENTYANNITVSAKQGVLHNSGSGTVTLGGTLSKDGSVLVLQGGAFNITGSINGASANSDLVVDSTTVTLSGTNNFNGPTSVINGGTLLVNGSLAADSDVTVASGATLGGSGSIAGAVSISGSLSPGAAIGSPAAVESLSSGALTFNSGSSFVYQMDSNAGASVAADFQKVFGDLALSGTVNLNLSDLSPLAFAPNTTLTLISYNGKWNGGFFTCDSTVLTDGAQFAVGANTWEIHYEDSDGGANFADDYAGGDYVKGHFINLTSSLTAIPEPASWLALGTLLSSGALLRSRRKSWVG